MPDDRQLIEAIRQGDQFARDRFVARYQPLFRQVFSRMVRDQQLAHDLMQEMFESILFNDSRVLEQWRGESTLKTYLIRVAQRLAQDKLRSRTYRPLGEGEVPEGQGTMPPEGGNDVSDNNPLTHVMSLEIRRAVDHCLDRLRPRDRELLYRRYIQGDKPQVIAGLMGLTPNSISAGLTRAGNRMKDCINRRFPGLFRRNRFAPHDSV